MRKKDEENEDLRRQLEVKSVEKSVDARISRNHSFV